MIVYELSHIFYRYADELIYSFKDLGLYYSYESVSRAIQYYSKKPGFCENQDAFSFRERSISGEVIDDTVFQVLIYPHSEDYEFETVIDLGLYGDEGEAQKKLDQYCRDNVRLVNANNLVVEKIINKCIIERNEWSEGFEICECD